MKQKPVNWFKVRIFVISCILLFCFVLVMARMFQLQVLKKEQLYRLASQQHHVRIPLLPKRGSITDREGNEMAVSIEVDSVYADPRKIVDPEKTARDLASILKIDPQETRQKLKSRGAFEWIQRQISTSEVEQIKALRLPGIFFLKENKRFYPNASLAPHVIGFVGLDSRGLEGIEFQHDARLNGKGRLWSVDRDALGREIAIEEISLDKEDHHENVMLTLDKQVQHVVEAELGRAVQKWGAKGGMAIAMDPFSGRVLAMASYPSFNPNQFLQYRSKIWRNRAIADAFEPGSLFKIWLAAAVIEEKIVRSSDSFFCENGSYNIYDRTIHDTSKHGWLTFQEIIKVSSNIGASKVGEKIGKDRYYRYITAFGFGEKTGIGLPGESKGIVHHPRYWSPVALDTIAFGQGISVTGIQLVAALSAIANGGSLMKPSMVEKITNEKGETLESFKPEVVRRVISEETAKKVTALLKTTTEKGGTGEGAVPTGYEVAGKTGTAQKVDNQRGGYSEDDYNSGFIGFAPADDPKVVLLVVIDEPQGATYGGVVAAPVFRTIMAKILPDFNVHPKGTVVVQAESKPGSSKRTRTPVPSIEEVKVVKTAAKEMMPDLTGLTMRNALNRIEGKGLIIRMSGNGRVVDQTPRPGAVIEKGDVCYLKLQSPS
jgi:cell division protein FtsI (penicillin-binding protein 3)